MNSHTLTSFKFLSDALIQTKGDEVIPRQSLKNPSSSLFFIGAGCSVTAGIPSVQEMVKSLLVKIAVSKNWPIHIRKLAIEQKNYTPLINFYISKSKPRPSFIVDDQINWWLVYSHIFENIYTTRMQQKRYVNDFIINFKGEINYTHLCLAELVRLGYCSTILTTNFDQLILEALARNRILPVICDSIETFSRYESKPAFSQLIHLHGSRDSYEVMNTIREIENHGKKNDFRRLLNTVFKDHKNFIFVGYSANEIWFNYLIGLRKVFPNKKIFWATFEKSITRMSDFSKEFLSLYPENTSIFYNQDADSFFLELFNNLEIEEPEIIRESVKSLSARTTFATSKNKRITQVLKTTKFENEFLDRKLKEYRITRSETNKSLTQAYKHTAKNEFESALIILKTIDETSALFEFAAQTSHFFSKTRDLRKLRFIVSIYREIDKLAPTDPPNLHTDCLINLASLLKDIGNADNNQNDFDEAINAYKKCNSLVKNNDDGELHSIINNGLGVVLFRKSLLVSNNKLSLLYSSSKHLEKALSYRNKNNYPQLWSNTIINKANVMKLIVQIEPFDHDNPTIAIRKLTGVIFLLREVIPILKSLKNEVILAKTYDSIGMIYFEQSYLFFNSTLLKKAIRPAEIAIKYSMMALDIFNKNNEIYYQYDASLNITRSALTAAYCSRNILALNEALKLANKIIAEIPREQTKQITLFKQAISNGNILLHKLNKDF